MDSSFIVGFIIAAVASGLFLLATFYFVRTVRSELGKGSDLSDADGLNLTVKAIWGYVAALVMLHFSILNLTHTNEPGIAAITNNALVVLDTMAKGVLLDLFESFDISLGHYEPEPDWAFAYAILIFVSRTYYSMAFAALILVYGTRLARWWRGRR